MTDFIKVKVIGVTQPVIDYIPDTEGILSLCARVSSPQNQLNFETGDRLLAYCAKNNHWSVFETASMTMEIECPRDIARQVLRHRSFAFQEHSARYSEMTNFVVREARLQDQKNRQNSFETDNEYLKAEWEQRQRAILDLVGENYQWALNQGIAKECARVILPEGLTISKMYMQGSVRSWMTYLKIRLGNGTQKEHVEVAEKVRAEFVKYFPSLEKFIDEQQEEG